MKTIIPNLQKIILYIFFLSLASSLFAETEPNDSYANANPLVLNENITGTIGVDDRIDFYKINITEDGRLSLLDSTGGTIQYYITLFDDDGSTKIQSHIRYYDNSGGRISVNLSPGTYYVKFDLYGSNPSGMYKLNADFVKTTYPGDIESNDISADAQILNLNNRNTGNLGNRKDGSYDFTDWWKFTVAEDGRLEIRDTTEAPLQYYISIYDADGTSKINEVLRYNDNSGGRLAVNLAPGTYFIKLNMYGQQYSIYGSYVVFPAFIPTTFPGDKEPNDVAEKADSLTLNKLNTGNLGKRKDNDYDFTDWWRLKIEEDGRLEINDSTATTLQYYVTIFDADATSQIQQLLRYRDNSGGRLAVNLSPGIYYLKLNMYGQQYSTYGSYKIDPVFTPTTYPGDKEPNDLTENADSLKLNKLNTGNLGNRKDGDYDFIDWWKFTVEEDGRLEIIDTTEVSLQYYIALWVKEGEKVIKEELRYRDNSGGRIAISLSPGDYYIRLKMYGQSYGTYGTYTINPVFVPTNYAGDAEPNDSIQWAQPINTESRNTGNLGSVRQGIYDEIDWWKLELKEDGLLTIADSTESNLAYYISIYEDDGETLIKQELRYKDNSGRRVQSKLTAGTYFVRLKKYGGNYTTYGSYTLDFKQLPKPLAKFELAKNINSIVLTNQSENADTYQWSFDDGSSSKLKNPSHTFSQPGDYLVELIVSNDYGNDTTSAELSIYGISEIKPQKGGNSGEVTITVLGGGLSKDANIKLQHKDYPSLEASSVYFYERGALRATFDLRNAALELYDIVVENPGKEPVVKEKAFMVVQADEPKPWVNLSGRSRALLNRWQTYTIFYGNTGNVDADLVPVWITVSDPINNQIQFSDLDVLYPDYAEDNNLNHKLDSIDFYFDIDTLWGKYEPTRVFPLYIPKIPAGYTGSLSFKIKTTSEVRINVWNNAPLMENGQLKSFCLEGNSLLGKCIEEAKIRAMRDLALTYIGLIPGGGCITSLTKEFFAIRDMRMQDFSKRRSWGSFTYAMTSLFLGCVADLVPVTKLWQLGIAVTGTIQFLHDGIYAAHNECHEKFGMGSHKNKNIRGVTSFDPNEIVGPLGYGSGNYIDKVKTVNYTIFFENKSSAGAPAQEIWIKDTLDMEKFDLDEFTFQEVSLGDSIKIPLFGQKEFAIDVDLRPKQEIIGRIIGSLDTLTGIVSVYFNSLNPETMETNEDPGLGILPPNINPHEGEGNVSFTVNLKEPSNGLKFANSATIIFDFNEPIKTNTWINTIDTIPPASKIENYNYDSNTGEVVLNLSGSDNLTGIEYYTIYMSKNDSAFIPVLRTSENSVRYKADENLEYRFYSLASDSIGNIESDPQVADISFKLTSATKLSENDYKVFPNPATDELFVQSSYSGIKYIEIISTDGKTVYIGTKIGNLVQINVNGFDKGIYLLKISDEELTTVKKIVIN